MKRGTGKIRLWAAFLIIAATVLISGSRELQMKAARQAAGEGMLRLVAETREHPVVALTFDDGPSKKYTPVLLEGLRERHVVASFFLMGKNIPGNEELLKQMQMDGHLLGNHTYNHVQLDKVTVEKAREEIEKTSNAIYRVTGCYPVYIRPPFGAWRKDLDLAVTMFPVFWDVDTLDWKSKNVASVLSIVEKNVGDGKIILMHDGYETSVEAALKIVDMLTEKGYEFVTVDRLLLL